MLVADTPTNSPVRPPRVRLGWGLWLTPLIQSVECSFGAPRVSTTPHRWLLLPSRVRSASPRRAQQCRPASAARGTGSVTVKRDTVAPTVTCGPTPSFGLTDAPAYVTATMSDSLSGTTTTSVTQLVSTNTPGIGAATITGTDFAGNVTNQSCPYTVTIPTCKGNQQQSLALLARAARSACRAAQLSIQPVCT